MREVADEEKVGERGSFGVREAKEGENIKKWGAVSQDVDTTLKRTGKEKSRTDGSAGRSARTIPGQGRGWRTNAGRKQRGEKYGNYADGTETAKVIRLQTPRFTAAGNLFAVGI